MRTWLIAGLAALIAGAGGMAITGFAANGREHAGGGKHKPAPVRCVDGASEVGDTYYPGIGNGGYDVAHYDLDLDYDPASRLLDGVATISASATQSLCRFNLDLRGLAVSSVRVDHAGADFRRDGACVVREGKVV